VIPAERFRLNPSPTVQSRLIGTAGKAVIVDDFYLNPDEVRGLQREVEFQREREVVFNFPGERALVPADTRHLVDAVCRHYGKADEPRGDLTLNLSRYRAVALEPLQRLPHVDATLTALVYLNEPQECAGGTAFYRHRSSGLERIPLRPDRAIVELAQGLGYTTADLKAMGYGGILERLFFNPQFAPDTNNFVNEGNSTWELLELVEMRFNRLLIYDGRIPHSMWVDPDAFRETDRLCQLLSVSLDGE
jgi:hypothetical protein